MVQCYSVKERKCVSAKCEFKTSIFLLFNLINIFVTINNCTYILEECTHGLGRLGYELLGYVWL